MKADSCATLMCACREKESQSATVELRGELRTIRVPDLLQLLASCQHTGTLIVRNGHDQKSLSIRGGKIFTASCLDRDNKNKLGRFLVKQGKVSEEQLSQALAWGAEHPPQPLGKALIEMGIVSKEDIRDTLRIQAEEIIYSLMAFPEGRFEFFGEEPAIDPEEMLSLDVMGLVMESVRREDEWTRMRAAIPSMDVVLGFASGTQASRNSEVYAPDQKMILGLIDGQRTVGEICAQVPWVDFEVCSFLYGLIENGLLTTVGDGIPRAVNP